MNIASLCLIFISGDIFSISCTGFPSRRWQAVPVLSPAGDERLRRGKGGRKGREKVVFLAGLVYFCLVYRL